MRIDVVNGHVVTGDGESYLEDTSVITQDGLITDLPKIRHVPYRMYSHRVLDAQGGLIMPGLINIHAHAVCFGPLCPGLPRDGVPEQRILANLDNHLLQGTTTVLSLDGFNLPFENDAINKLHPMNVKKATLHTPKNVASGDKGAGKRLEGNHRTFTAEEDVASGAVAIGEVGSRATTGATYEKNVRLERPISTSDALALDDAYVAGVRRQNKWDKRGAFKACNLDANRLRQFSDLPTSVRLDSFASPPVSSPVWRLAVRGTYPPA